MLPKKKMAHAELDSTCTTPANEVQSKAVIFKYTYYLNWLLNHHIEILIFAGMEALKK
jgi:hypothetical protein